MTGATTSERVTKDFLSGPFETLADKRQVRVICSTDQVDRAGEIVDQAGIDLSGYRSNPIVLWNHRPDQPIARTLDIGVTGGRLQALVQFPDAGTSQKSDEIYGLIRAGVVNSTSIGFSPVDAVPMPGGNKIKGPFRYLKSMLLELSFCAIPANSGAVVTQRALGDHAAAEAERQRRLRDVEVLRLADAATTADERAAARRLRNLDLLRVAEPGAH